MLTLKQKFTLWFNRTRERVGTLWEAQFKSVIVEGEWSALLKVAAYIDLNPVRAGLVESREAVAEVWRSGGKLSLAQLLRCRIRHFTDGVAIGSESFVERVFNANRAMFSRNRVSGHGASAVVVGAGEGCGRRVRYALGRSGRVATGRLADRERTILPDASDGFPMWRDRSIPVALPPGRAHGIGLDLDENLVSRSPAGLAQAR